MAVTGRFFGGKFFGGGFFSRVPPGDFFGGKFFGGGFFSAVEASAEIVVTKWDVQLVGKRKRKSLKELLLLLS